MPLNPWSINPAWQNFSSLFREALAAHEARTALEKTHHLTSSLYFGIAALEAFINQELRRHLAGQSSEGEIYNRLRKEKLKDKLSKWPDEITGKQATVPREILTRINQYNDVRGNLTHPKDHGHDLYESLLQIEPLSVVDTVAQYIVCFHEGQGTRFPYWVFGWNYLNPRPDIHEIILINDQQFLHSLAGMGVKVPAYDYARAEAWKDQFLASLNGYEQVRDFLKSRTDCEPKQPRFPHQPKLCRRWWTNDHHMSCGHVSAEAMGVAMAFDRPRG